MTTPFHLLLRRLGNRPFLRVGPVFVCLRFFLIPLLCGLFSGPALFSQSPEEISRIVSSFVSKETEFRAAWLNYTYTQAMEMKILRVRGRGVSGQYFQMNSEIYFDDKGKRNIRVTRRMDRLRDIGFTREDEEVIHNLQPFVLTTEDLPDYDVQFVKKIREDELDCYLFAVTPKRMRKGHFYFKGQIWVDQQDLQIVMTRGKPLPEPKNQRFPEFETRRELIDGKFWFPTWTEANDTLQFPNGDIEIQETVTYGNYKRFNVDATIRFGTDPAPPKK